MNSRRYRNSRQLLPGRVLASIALILIISTITLITLNAYERISHVEPIKSVVTTKINKNTNIKVGLPIQLKIPSISVDTSIYYVGLKADGTMDIKTDPTIVAWYQFGPRPGESGSAVIAGHYGWIGNQGSIFNDIHTLLKGDEILVIDDNNITTTFVVRESRKYDPEADATNVFKSSDGKSHLNLITCEGVWENDKQTYSNRLVVFSDKK